MAETFESLDWVRRNYAVPAEVGMRVRHEGEGGAEGTILGGDAQYVAVRFDGEQHASRCHPLSLDYGDGVAPADRLAKANAHIDRVNELLNKPPAQSPAAGEGRTPRERAEALIAARADATRWNGRTLLERKLVAAADLVAELLPAVPDGGQTADARGIAAMLAEFHRVFAHPNDTDELRRSARLVLHQEEHAELVEAMESGDRVAIARELADVVYVAYGSALTWGIDLDAAVREVHRANMSKLGADGRPIQRDDGKILKGPNFRPPDMTAALNPAPPAPVEGEGRGLEDDDSALECDGCATLAPADADGWYHGPPRAEDGIGETLCPRCSARAAADEARLLGDPAAAPVETGDGAADGVALIAAERRRQVEQEGWTPEHDDEHDQGELARAAACYAQYAGTGTPETWGPPGWPWDVVSWKPSGNPARDLAKAGALCAAEIDRLQRAELVAADEVASDEPQDGDRVRVTSGDYAGKTGLYEGRCETTGAHLVHLDGGPAMDQPVACDVVERLVPSPVDDTREGDGDAS